MSAVEATTETAIVNAGQNQTPVIFESIGALDKAKEDRYQLYISDQKTIKNTVCKQATHEQFIQFCRVAADNQLNPYLKQIWFDPTIGVVCGRDSYIVCAQRRPDYQGFVSNVVCELDDFEYDAATQTVLKHIVRAARGKLIKSYCICYRKNCKPVYFEAPYEQYAKNGPAWKYTYAMLLTKAESNAFRRQFPIDGLFIANEGDYDLDALPASAILNDQDPLRGVGDLGATALNQRNANADEHVDNFDQEERRLAEEEAARGPQAEKPTAFGYEFRTTPDAEWFDEPMTEPQIKSFQTLRKKRGVDEEKRKPFAFAIASAVDVLAREMPTDWEAWSTKSLSRADAAYLIDFLTHASAEEISTALAAAGDPFADE